MRSTIEHVSELPTQLTNTILINPPKPLKDWGRHSRVVMATSSGNHMNTCQDVREIYNECRVSHSNASICKTAASYFSICMNKDLQ
jgi:hypothetical protein